jgi:hypothetical protein
MLNKFFFYCKLYALNLGNKPVVLSLMGGLMFVVIVLLANMDYNICLADSAGSVYTGADYQPSRVEYDYMPSDEAALRRFGFDHDAAVREYFRFKRNGTLQSSDSFVDYLRKYHYDYYVKLQKHRGILYYSDPKAFWFYMGVVAIFVVYIIYKGYFPDYPPSPDLPRRPPTNDDFPDYPD